HACHYGIDTTQEKFLVARERTIEQVRDYIGADSLYYLSTEGMIQAVGPRTDKGHGFCLACFDSDYPVQIMHDVDKYSLERGGHDD
ncbi:MAG: hypothetical protein ACM3XM_09825, partial [Mycobacterium leprae]